MGEEPPLVRVYLTGCALSEVVIEEAWGQVTGDCCFVAAGLTARSIPGEGSNWHRQRWAAENYARQLQAARLGILREEIARLEGYRFGRIGR